MRILRTTTAFTVAMALAVAGLSIGPAQAQRAHGSLGCSSMLSVDPNPHGILIKNLDEGGHTIPRGTTFQWVMAPSGQHGVVTLTADLKPGRTFYIDDVLTGPGKGNVECTIVVA
jgi:hypothetical protein